MSEASAAEKLAEHRPHDHAVDDCDKPWKCGHVGLCHECERPWPCEVSALTTRLAEAQEELERWRKLALFNSDRMNAAEARLAEVERAGAEYIRRTDPALACGTTDDPAAGKCGTCRACAFERVDRLEAAIQAECAKFRFPDEDRPELWAALSKP